MSWLSKKAKECADGQWVFLSQTKPEQIMFFPISNTGDLEEKDPSSPDRSQTYDLLVTSPDVLPLSYRRLVGAKVIKPEHVPTAY